MRDIFVYDTIEQKNIVETNSLMNLDSHNSLVHTLNVMDFMAALYKNKKHEDDGIEWIVLELRSRGKKRSDLTQPH